MAVRELLNDFVEEARDFQSRVKSFSDGLTASKLSDEDLKSRCIELARETVKETWKEDKILEQIEDVKLINFPTVDAFILFSTGKIEIQLLREALDSYDGSKDSMARLDRDCDALFTTIDNLEAHAQEIAPFHLWGAGPPNFFDRLAQASQAAFSWFRAGWLKLIGSGR